MKKYFVFLIAILFLVGCADFGHLESNDLSRPEEQSDTAHNEMPSETLNEIPNEVPSPIPNEIPAEMITNEHIMGFWEEQRGGDYWYHDSERLIFHFHEDGTFGYFVYVENNDIWHIQLTSRLNKNTYRSLSWGISGDYVILEDGTHFLCVRNYFDPSIIVLELSCGGDVRVFSRSNFALTESTIWSDEPIVRDWRDFVPYPQGN